MIQRRTPLKRGTKPLKRTPLKQGKGRRAKAVDAVLEAAKDIYFKGLDVHVCQLRRCPIHRKACDAHHKIKRSLWATASAADRIAVGYLLHGLKNLVILCRPCHTWAHDESHPENLAAVRKSEANALNGRKI